MLYYKLYIVIIVRGLKLKWETQKEKISGASLFLFLFLFSLFWVHVYESLKFRMIDKYSSYSTKKKKIIENNSERLKFD